MSQIHVYVSCHSMTISKMVYSLINKLLQPIYHPFGGFHLRYWLIRICIFSYIAAIAALYVTMSVGLLVGRSVAMSFNVCSNALKRAMYSKYHRIQGIKYKA